MNEALVDEIHAIYLGGATADSKDKLARLLRDEGVAEPGGVADFVTRLMEHLRTSGPSPIEAGEDALAAIDARRADGAEIVHRPPEQIFYWQGEAIEPRDIRRFDGRPLHFAIIGDSSGARLTAFETHREVREAFRHQSALVGALESHQPESAAGEADGPAPPQFLNIQSPTGTTILGPGGGYITCPADLPRPSSEAQFFQHINFDGHWFWLTPNWRIPDLTRKDLSRSIFSPGNWNDTISSIKAGDGLVILWEHIHFRGSSFSLPGSGEPTPKYSLGPCGRYVSRWDYPKARIQIPDLRQFGWNDRLSSVEHYL